MHFLLSQSLLLIVEQYQSAWIRRKACTGQGPGPAARSAGTSQGTSAPSSYCYLPCHHRSKLTWVIEVNLNMLILISTAMYETMQTRLLLLKYLWITLPWP